MVSICLTHIFVNSSFIELLLNYLVLKVVISFPFGYSMMMLVSENTRMSMIWDVVRGQCRGQTMQVHVVILSSFVYHFLSEATEVHAGGML